MTTPQDRDQLVLRYREASAQDGHRPAGRVREAVRAHAQMLLAARQTPDSGVLPQAPAANQSGWRVSMFASVLLASLAGLLVLQFDQGTPQEKELVHGAPRPGAATVAPAKPAPPLESALEMSSGAGGRPAVLAPEVPAAKLTPPAPTRARAAAEPSTAEHSTAKPSSPEPFASARLADAPADAAPQQDAQAQPQASGHVASKAALAPVLPSAAAAPTLRLGAPARGAQGITASASALHQAARTGLPAELERQIVLAGGQLNALDAAGRTPLMLAVINGHAQAVQRLLAAGANPALQDREGLTALQHARRLGLDTIAALIEAAR